MTKRRTRGDQPNNVRHLPTRSADIRRGRNIERTAAAITAGMMLGAIAYLTTTATVWAAVTLKDLAGHRLLAGLVIGAGAVLGWLADRPKETNQ